MNMKLLLLSIGLAALFLSISSWTPVVIISTHPDNMTYSNRNPQIAVDSSGNSYVTWQGRDENDQDIYWVKIDSSGTPGTVEKISIHPDNMDHKDSLPQIAVDAAGNSYVVWQGRDENDSEIYWVKIDSAGRPGQVQKISNHPDCISYHDLLPQIAVDTAGNSYVVWQGRDENDSEIYWVKIDSAGRPGQVQKISNHPDNIDHGDHDPQIAVDAAGNSYVLWHGCDEEGCWDEPGDLEIYWVKIDASGVPGRVQKIPPTSPDNVNTMDMIPQIAVDVSGNSYATWSGMDETSYNIYWVKTNASENVKAVQKISNYPDVGYDDYNPQITVDSSGILYITWENFDKNDYDIFWAKIDASRNERTVQKISTYLFSTVYDDRLPQIAVDSSGNSYITWESFNRKPAEQFDQTICWIKVDAEGNPGKVHNISSCQERKHFDQNPRIAVSARGNSYITWRGQDASKIDHIFFTAHFTDSTPISGIIEIIVIIIVLVVVIGVIIILIRKKMNKNQIMQENDR